MNPNKLLIDAGNTRVKAAQMDADGHLEPLFNLSYEELRETHLQAPVASVWLALVGGAAQQSLLNEWMKSQCGQAQVYPVTSEAHKFGVSNAYSEPTHLGVDRWLALLGAYNENKKPTLIIDAGTAITVDWIDDQGQHLGGWIAPGVDMMQKAVTDRAPRVFTDTQKIWGRVNQLGTSTPDGLLDGCVNMFAGIVRQALHVTETELDWFDYRLLFSGGSIPLLPVELKRKGELRSELVLQGLALYAREQSGI
ncbi:type III pantothenate kinase [Pseudidiomarina sp. 1APR75-15]|uniref:Type III pantothenate kinase n=1 Tax=Pseudidiomarina terrestris TaxID=2820060 RepID=A0ABT8MJZ7_9GAMM|nr:type III pantothenate kinase [Pseudidiomarina sp. 1APR75-15]MDN7130275.1 type III pantothenate kinase [Pseudidiomarina sp. 1APR75-15]